MTTNGSQLKPQPQCSLYCTVLGSELMALRARRDSARATSETMAKENHRASAIAAKHRG